MNAFMFKNAAREELKKKENKTDSFISLNRPKGFVICKTTWLQPLNRV